METRSRNTLVLNSNGPSLAAHPGEVLQEELKSRGLLQNAFATRIGMQPSHLSALIHGKRNVTPAIAKKLERELGIPAQVWMNLQNLYRLGGTGTSHLVAGYHIPTENNSNRQYSHYLNSREADEQPLTTVTLTIPVSDMQILKTLASRLGWTIV